MPLKKVKRNKAPNIHTKVGRYFMAVQKKGVTKKEAQVIAGYATDTHATSIERSSEFKALQTFFKDSFLQKMSMDEIADALIDNIKQPGQERKDRNAINGAVKIVLDKLEPENRTIAEEGDKVMIILSK